MATRGQMKSVELKQTALAASSPNLVAEVSAAALRAGNSIAAMKVASMARPVAVATTRPSADSASPIAAAAANGAPHAPRFTGEETILLQGLASGATSKEMAAQMRLPRESLYRLIGDLRRKTGASSDTALSVWVLRNKGSGGSDRGGGR